MVAKCFLPLHVLQTVFTDPKLWNLAVFVWIRREVPGVDFVLAELDAVDVLDFSQLKIEER